MQPQPVQLASCTSAQPQIYAAVQSCNCTAIQPYILESVVPCNHRAAHSRNDTAVHPYSGTTVELYIQTAVLPYKHTPTLFLVAGVTKISPAEKTWARNRGRLAGPKTVPIRECSKQSLEWRVRFLNPKTGPILETGNAKCTLG